MPISSSTKIEGATSRYLKLRSPKRRCIGSAGPAVDSDCDTRTLLKLSAAAPCGQPAAEWGRVTKSAAARSYTHKAYVTSCTNAKSARVSPALLDPVCGRLSLPHVARSLRIGAGLGCPRRI